MKSVSPRTSSVRRCIPPTSSRPSPCCARRRGIAAGDIAARFGVSPAVVRQRLKLAAVSPALIAVYREGGMTLEQVMAFTLTNGHARQQEVWQGLGWDKGADAIRRALTDGPGGGKRAARAVCRGRRPYRGWWRDHPRPVRRGRRRLLRRPALLDRLVLAKLEREAEAVRAEGWAWTTVTPEFDFRAAKDMRRVYPAEPELNGKAARRMKKLATEYDELVAIAENEEMTEALQARFDQLEANIEALKGHPVYDLADIAAGGAFVSLGIEGGVRVERGFIRKAAEPHAEDVRGRGGA